MDGSGAAVTWDALEAVGREAGLDLVGAATAEPFDGARAVLEERKAAGLAGSMQFTYKSPARSTDPARTLPGVRTLVVGAASYHRDRPDPPAGQPAARVARYVWADDQARLLRGLQAMCDRLVADGYRACVVADQNHLVDRVVAHRAGLGWYGKNANLLVPGRGSWLLLGTVLTDAVLPDAPVHAAPAPDGCGTCDRCLPACPTDAIVAPGVVDGRRCLSWLLQAPGVLPEAVREAVGDRIYGCDDCQEVCPPNRREERRAAPGGRGTPVALGRPERAWVPVLELLEASDQELLERYGHWYIAERNPRYLRRNALVVLGNVGDGRDPRVRRALAAALWGDGVGPVDPLLAEHARWSARRLGCDDLAVAPKRSEGEAR